MKSEGHRLNEEFPDDLFEKHDVVVLGETFHGSHTNAILYVLDKFGSQIDKVFIELPADYQDSVNAYLISGVTDATLENFFAGAESEGKNVRDLLKIFDKIREIGKEVVCFDSSKSVQGEYSKASSHRNEKYFLRGESRDEDMFTTYELHRKQVPGKYLMIVGANHAGEGNYTEGDKRLGERLKEVIGEKYTNIEMGG